MLLFAAATDVQAELHAHAFIRPASGFDEVDYGLPYHGGSTFDGHGLTPNWRLRVQRCPRSTRPPQRGMEHGALPAHPASSLWVTRSGDFSLPGYLWASHHLAPRCGDCLSHFRVWLGWLTEPHHVQLSSSPASAPVTPPYDRHTRDRQNPSQS